MNKVILVLAPHTDDGEWGCGGSIAKWIEQGHDVHYVAFSAAEESVPKDLSPNILRDEILNATEILGVSLNQVRVLNFPVRHFPRDRQNILEEMIKLRSEIKPDIVLTPSSYDTHQDHAVINQETFRAFKRSTILGYEIPWNNREITLMYFNSLNESFLNKKIASLAAYKSQLFRAPNYKELITSLAIQRGSQVGIPYAEAFEVIRWIDL